MGSRLTMVQEWIARKYRLASPVQRAATSSAIVGVTSYVTALLGVQITEIFKLQQPVVIFTHALIAIVVITLLVFSAAVLRLDIQKKAEFREQTIAHAHTMADSWVTKCAGWLCRAMDNERDKCVYIPHNPYISIRKLVRLLFDTLEAFFSNSRSVDDRINFEVTYMTQSILDGKITILAWANREDRMPHSMTLRQANPDIYDQTVTAELYKDSHANPRVIENTLARDSTYRELYDRQRERIKSSIVYPVISNTNSLLGTLVLHCDSEGFFKLADIKLWRELCEVFSKRIALEHLRLFKAIEVDKDPLTAPATSIARYQPF